MDVIIILDGNHFPSLSIPKKKQFLKLLRAAMYKKMSWNVNSGCVWVGGNESSASFFKFGCQIVYFLVSILKLLLCVFVHFSVFYFLSLLLCVSVSPL